MSSAKILGKAGCEGISARGDPGGTRQVIQMVPFNIRLACREE